MYASRLLSPNHSMKSLMMGLSDPGGYSANLTLNAGGETWAIERTVGKFSCHQSRERNEPSYRLTSVWWCSMHGDDLSTALSNQRIKNECATLTKTRYGPRTVYLCLPAYSRCSHPPVFSAVVRRPYSTDLPLWEGRITGASIPVPHASINLILLFPYCPFTERTGHVERTEPWG